MKYKLLFSFLLMFFVANNLFSQSANYSFSTDSTIVSFQRCDTIQEAVLTITNNSNMIDTLIWKRTKHSGFPSNWTVTTCDNVTCYGPGISTRTFFIAPHASATITMNVDPSSVAGTGIIDLKIVRSNNADSISGYYKFSFACKNVGINNLNSTEARIFPLPFTSGFNIQLNQIDSKPKYIDVYNMLGSLMYKQEINSSTTDNVINVNPGSLPKGMYFVTVSDINKKVILSKRIQKD